MPTKASLTSYFYTKPLETEKKKSKASLLAEKKNTGSGTGYVLGKLGLGLTNVFENTGKLVSGSLHQLFGDDRMAKYTFSSPTMSERADYNLTKSYNPNGAMGLVGDVASGLGQNSVFLLDAVGIPVGATILLSGAVGASTSEAVRTTGELGMKEYIHGALTGANEWFLEMATGKAGTKLLTAAAKGAKTTGLNLFAKEAVRKGLGRNMLESAGGEFIEEFLSEPMSVIWKRATGVDPDAEVNWMNAVYSGLVGFSSGGIMGGLTSSALNAYDYINGTKAKNNGREQVILNAAETIKDRFKTDKKYSTQMNDSITNLQAAYNTYNKAKSERAKTIALGDMWRNIATLEASAGVQNAYERITDTAERAGFDTSAKANAEEMAQTATQLLGREVTVDMLKNNTDNVSSDLAVHSWAVGFFANEDSRIKEIENKIAFESAPEYSEENSSLIDEMSDGEHFIYGVGGKKAIIYKQANGYNLGFSEGGTDDIQMARNLSSEQVKLMLADAKEENLSKYKVAMAADRFYENYSGKSTEDTENEEKNVPTQETAANDNEETEKATTNPEKQENATERKKNASEEESRGDTNSNDNDDSGFDQEQAEREEASKTEKLKKKKERTTAELDRARKLIKNFDLLSYEKRESILRMLESHSSIPYYVAKFAAHHIANTGTHIMFSDTITSKGFHTVLKTKQGNEALIVVRPEKSSIGTTILHEIFHDVRDSKHAKELIDYVKKYPSFDDEKKKYADDYKKNLKRELKDDELLTEEAAANIISERLDSDRFLQTWAKKDKNIIMRIYASLSQYVHRMKNKSKPVDFELRRLEKKYTAALRSVMSERKYKKFISDLEEWLDSRTKYMYAGEGAKTADKLKLDTAKEMLDSGMDSETVRQETGWHKGNGYDGYSMSNNARSAYASGEMPISKWTKAEIVEAVADINPNIDISKLNLDTLKSKFLRRSSWHHTSKMYNATDFYSIDEEYIKKLVQSDVDGIASKQVSKPRTQRDMNLDKRVEHEYKKVLTLVEAGILSTENGAIKRLITGKGFEDGYQKAVELIRRRDASRVDQWRSLPADHYRQEYVRLYDTDIEAYIQEMYADKKLSKNSKAFEAIANYISFNDETIKTSKDGENYTRMALPDSAIDKKTL